MNVLEKPHTCTQTSASTLHDSKPNSKVPKIQPASKVHCPKLAKYRDISSYQMSKFRVIPISHSSPPTHLICQFPPPIHHRYDRGMPLNMCMSL